VSATSIITIVEGEGEEAALPVLLRRIAQELFGRYDVTFPPGRVHGRGNLTRDGGIEDILERTVARTPDVGCILVLIDADDDCPAALGPELLRRARQARADKSISVVLANREYEAWFLASAPSIAGRRGLGTGLEVPSDPEKPRDCKGWLTDRRIDGNRYRPTVDQAALTAIFDLRLALANAPSFDKFCREVERLLGE
jgi:Domain of unknown function (DUF4276)